MKKRLFIVALCLCLLISTLPMAAMADNKLAFISINDTLPPELINGFTYYGGAIYVPAWIFASYGFGIFLSYSSDTNTATVYNSIGSLIFELSSGKTYDDAGNQYTLSGKMRGGNIYVPLSYIASYFGTFSYSTINTEFGTIVRLKDGRVCLSDAEFVKPAMNLLEQYYNAYNKDSGEDDESQLPTPDDGSQHEGLDILMAFIGLPGDDCLAAMAEFDIAGCFFLTAEQVRSDPDRVRRIAGEGHRLGVLWEGESGNFDETADLIFEAARVSTAMVSSKEEDRELCAAFAEERGLAYYECDLEAAHGPEDDVSPYTITSYIEVYADEEGMALLLNSVEGMGETLRIVFNYLRANKFDLFSPSEILL